MKYFNIYVQFAYLLIMVAACLSVQKKCPPGYTTHEHKDGRNNETICVMTKSELFTSFKEAQSFCKRFQFLIKKRSNLSTNV